MIPASPLYTDELVSSGLVRCCRWFNVPFKRFAREVLRVPGLRLNFLNVWPLRPLEKVFNLGAEDLLWKHTSFPYATAFLTGECFQQAHIAALDGGPHLPRLLATMQNVTSQVPHRRLCSRCLKESIASEGESYWERSHNLPGTLFCAKHSCSLVTTGLPASSTLRTIYDLPIECIQRVVDTPALNPSKALLALARESQELLDRRAGPGESRTSSWYRGLAISTRWLSPDREVSLGVLQSMLRQTYPEALLSQAGTTASKPNWAALFFRPATGFNLAPLKHMLIQTLLAHHKATRPMLDYVPPGPPGTSSEAVDAFYAPRARRELRRALQKGEVLNTEQFLRRVGAFGPYRHRAEELPALRHVVRTFRGSPASVKQLGPGKTLYRNDSCSSNVGCQPTK